MKAHTCFLSMFDIIGFKSLRTKLGTDGLYKKYQNGIKPMIEHSAAGKGKTIEINGKKLFVSDFSDISVNYKIISDSVILYTKDDSFTSFVRIINSSFMLLQSGFNGGKAPYRGAISHGDLIDDMKGTYIGSSVEDAYIGEQSQVWSGCILTASCRAYVEENNFIEYLYNLNCNLAKKHNGEKRDAAIKNIERIVLYDVPKQKNPKTGAIEYYYEKHYTINWVVNMYQGAATASFEESDDPHAKLIKKNTIDFESWSRKTSPLTNSCT